MLESSPVIKVPQKRMVDERFPTQESTRKTLSIESTAQEIVSDRKSYREKEVEDKSERESV